MSERDAEQRGYIQGVAWAIAVLGRYPIGAGGVLKESGITYGEFKASGVVANDLRVIREICKLERISTSCRVK